VILICTGFSFHFEIIFMIIAVLKTNVNNSCSDDDVGRENSGFQSAEFQENDGDIRAAAHHRCIAFQLLLSTFNCYYPLSTATIHFQLQGTIDPKRHQINALLSTASLIQ
jgi:hypothetical protein